MRLARSNVGRCFGGSWGSALALAYTETHPERVSELIVRGIFTLRRSELDFYYNGPAGMLFPDRYEGYLAPLGGRGFRGDTIAAYAELLFDPDPDVHGPAALAWSTWEAATITLEPNPDLFARLQEPSYALAFARIENHYFNHGGWFGEGQLSPTPAGSPASRASSCRAATTSPPRRPPPGTCTERGRRPTCGWSASPGTRIPSRASPPSWWPRPTASPAELAG